MCNFDLAMSCLFSLGFSYALITAIAESQSNTKKDQINYAIFSLSWFLAAWVLYTFLLYLERRSVQLYAIGDAPSALTRWFWIVQFLLCLKNMESILVANYENSTIDINGQYQGWYYFQLFASIPFFVVFIRGISLHPNQAPAETGYDSQFFPSKLSMQQYQKTKLAHSRGYSVLNDEESIDYTASFPSRTYTESRADDRRKMTAKTAAKQYPKTPEETASLFGYLTFGWLSGVFVTGYKRPLEMEDLHYLRGQDHSHESVKLFYQSWRKQLKRAKEKNLKYEAKHPHHDEQEQKINVAINEPLAIEHIERQVSDDTTAPKHERMDEDAKYHPSIVGAVLSAFGGPFYLAGPLKLIYDLVQYAGPVILAQYLRDAEKFGNGEKENIDEAYMYAGLLFFTYMLGTFILANYFHRCFRTGMRVRSGLMAACYDKTLKLSQTARTERTAGEIMTLVTVDVRKVRDVFPYCWMMISAPFQIGLAIYLLYQQISWAVFVGIAAQTVLMAPLQTLVGINARKLQKQVMKVRDKRMEVVNEVFGAMKIVKMYAWEMSFGNKITKIRNEELSILRCYIWWYTIMVLFWGWAPTLVSLAAFIAYTGAGHELTAEKAFTSIALFNLLRFPLAMLPMVVLSFIEANVCLGRIRKFLSANEIDPDTIEYAKISQDKQPPSKVQTTRLKPPKTNSNGLLSGSYSDEPIEVNQPEEEEKDDGNSNADLYDSPPTISIQNATFTWDDTMNQVALSDINIDFRHGNTTMIIGETGSGKSALLRAILGNLTKSSGHIVYGESRINTGQHIRVAYSSQVAWIQNAKLRDNILFNTPLDQQLYDRVIEACALTDDLKILPGGDETEIGEKGINLSGGQKQRVSLARAVYSNADVYVFDDPLSAVDSHVANHIFNRCFLDLLKGKTIILATHAVSFLKYADNVLVMDGGKISLQGKLQDLIDAKVNLTKFIIHKDDKKGAKGDGDGDEEEDDNKEEDDVKTDESAKSLTRQKSAEKEAKDKEQKKKDEGKLVQDEERGKGDVDFAIYWLYIKAAGGVLLFLFYIFFLGSYYGSNTVATFWLAFWSDQKLAGKHLSKSQWWWLDVYIIIQTSSLVVLFLSCVMALITRLRASKYLHESLLSKMLHAPMSFFDTTPIGRIVNRFARDMYAIDQAVPGSYQSALRITIYLFSVTLGVCIVTPYFALSLIPLGALYYYLQKYFITTSRELRRLSTLQNSPIYSNFSESIAGVDVLRSFNKADEFSHKNKNMIDKDHQAYYPSVAANRWLAIRLEFIGNCLIGAAALFCAITQPPAGLVGVALSTIMSVTQGLNWFVRQKAQLEQDIVSVERIDQYANAETPQENPYIVQGSRPPAKWPQDGQIAFNNVWMRYREGLEYVLKGLTFEINPGEKIGVIGRTGAGKSSLFVTLLRLVEIEKEVDGRKCQILIDNLDVSSIGLQDLRSKLSVIPQDPVLFTGTVRFNLDPFEQNDDEVLLDALRLSHCYDAMKKMIIEITIKKERDEQQEKEKKEKDNEKKKNKKKDKKEQEKQKPLLNESNSGINRENSVSHINVADYMDNPKYRDLNPLDIMVEENGSNFSVGQRQLLCLARAIVRGSKILLLDEATSAVDPQTDQLIQQTIRSVFKTNTILTIAHRIDTILDYDRILIMDKGKVLEYDTPKTLLENDKSRFSEIVQESFGVNLDDVLRNKMKQSTFGQDAVHEQESGGNDDDDARDETQQ